MSTKKILIVDDSLTMRRLIKIVLTKTGGFDVTEGEDGVDGLNKAKETAFDLIISDISMPNMNGIDMVRKIREIPSYSKTPIMMLTTESSQKAIEEGKSLVNAWGVKPIAPEILLTSVNKLLGT